MFQTTTLSVVAAAWRRTRRAEKITHNRNNAQLSPQLGVQTKHLSLVEQFAHS
jgi:hypothetical protein